MNLPDLQAEERTTETRHEAAEIPTDLPLTEVRRRLRIGMGNLADNPGMVVSAWLASLSSPPLGVGEA